MKIIDASKEDAPLIAEAILEAVGPEIILNLAGKRNTIEDVRGIFMRLAAREDSQYSYINSRIARDQEGKPMGVCVSYDGADLIRLRRPFFKEANRVLGWEMKEEEIDALPGETSPDEYYLDTLMTLPEHRGKGVGRALILDALSKARQRNKPLGLLCDMENKRARRLYDAVGFIKHSQRPFAGHLMDNLRLI
ncbi:MAG: GNAT family N-acetyltransferase [Muribaculaceae bacterium]|nr:GNAT family N-acetyltransferase [Muribaculaceae bacterium]